MTFRASAFTIHQRKNGPAGAEQFDQPVCCRLADTQFDGEFANFCGCRIAGPALQEFTNRISPSARFIPKRFVNLIGK